MPGTLPRSANGDNDYGVGTFWSNSESFAKIWQAWVMFHEKN